MDRADRRALRIGEAARYLGVSRSTLLQAEQAGEVEPHRTPGGHRRYNREYLDEVLDRWSARGVDGLVGRDPAPPESAHGAETSDGHWLRADLPETARTGLRQIVRLLEVHAAGVWLGSHAPGQRLEFCAGYRMPRWLTDRLVDQPAPEPLRELVQTGGYRMMEAESLRVPSDLAGGPTLAVVVQEPGEPPLGVLAVFAGAGHRWSPDELRSLGECQGLLATTLKQRIEIDRLERTLDRVRRLCS
jgi:excisionase family DNA binding protein